VEHLAGNTATRPRLALAVLCVGQFVVVLDATIVTTALPLIGRSLGFPTADLQWVITGYTMTFGGFLICGGRLADLIGPRRAFLTGLCLFVVASLGCALAWSPAALIAARGLQGLGAAVLSPAALSLLGGLTQAGEQRRWALGWWTAAAAIGGASGWMLGGILAQYLGWRSVFWVNLPIGVLAVAAARALPPGTRAAGRRLDVAGALGVTTALSLLVLALTDVGKDGVTSASSWVPGAVAGVVLAATIWHERRSTQPLIPAVLLRSRSVLGANGTAFMLTASTTPAMFVSVLFVQQALHLSPVRASLLFPVFNLAVISGSLAAPRLLGRHGARRTLLTGFLSIATGMAILAAMPNSEMALAFILVSFALMGAGLGAASVASTQTGTESIDRADAGAAAGVLNSAAQLGTAFGLALLTGLVTSGSDIGDAYRAGYLGTCALAIAGMLLSLLVPAVQTSPDRPKLIASQR
jgi:MFS family permease